MVKLRETTANGEMTKEEMKEVTGGRYESKAHWTNVPY